MKRALVFSGGGAKGAYQVGAWKALRKLNIKFDIVTGTSIGAINGALFAMEKYNKARFLWMNTKFSDLFNLDIRSFSKNSGLSFEKAQSYLNNIINENQLRKSKIDYGLVTYSLNNKQPKCLQKDDIPDGKLLDYIIASSSCFPVVEAKKIGEDLYIDGGYYDNVPINLAIDMGADEVVAIDLAVLSLKQSVLNKNVKIQTIKCKDKKLFTIDFNKDYANKMFNLGYNDTMKYFKELDGSIYTFYKNELKANYQKLERIYISILGSLILLNEDNILVRQIYKSSKFKDLLIEIRLKRDISAYFLDSMEYLGELFELDNVKIYKAKTFNNELLKRVNKLEHITFDKNIKGKLLIGYIYKKYIKATNLDDIKKEMFNLALIFPKEFLAAIYLITISGKYILDVDFDDCYNKVITFLKR